MAIACWSVKGGSGTTVVAAALALRAARAQPGGLLLVDLVGELPAVLGLPTPEGPGVAEWLATSQHVPDALARLVVRTAPGVGVVPLGSGPPPGAPEAGERLVEALDALGEPSVVDVGVPGSALARAVIGASATSLLVLRPCYLALKRAIVANLRIDGLIVIREPGRALSATDLGDVLGVPVRAEVQLDPAVARAVDAGLLAARLPRALDRGLRGAA